MFSSTKNRGFNASSFQVIKDAMLQSDELPLSDVIKDEQWQAAFDEHGVNFGADEDSIYTPAITLWGLISQVFFKEENRSCKAAVIRIASLWAMLGRTICSTNNGAYCRARLKIPFEAIRDITRQIACSAEAVFDQQELDESQADAALPSHAVVAAVELQPATGRILLVDGFTVTAADTPENQKEFPQNPSQKEGLGFPIIRCVSLISMVTGLLVDVMLGPYAGKQSGETALMWKMLGRLNAGDTLVADCFYCTYWIVAACKAKGVNIVMKNHHKRDDGPLGAKRIDKHQRTTVWLRPKRPTWMSEQEYDMCPEQIDIRLVDITIEQAGFRSKKFTIATTAIATQLYSQLWLASVYRSRWLVELDIRSIKCSLGMDVVRAKTPEMVKTEIWSCLLAYNLIRMKMLQSCAVTGRTPRTLSFTTTLQLLATNWVLASVSLTPELLSLGNQTSSSEAVGNRLDRIEPRANKRRPKVLALLNKPRQLAKAELMSAA